jgi:hypothetical protein
MKSRKDMTSKSKGADHSGLITVAVCVVAVVLAIWPAFSRHSHVVYDPSLAIYTVTFMGIAAYTFYQRRTLIAQENALEYAKEHDRLVRQQAEADAAYMLKTRRANLATALLGELKMILVRVESVTKQGPASYHNPIPHPVVTEAMRHTELFSPETVHRLAAVAFRLGDVERLMSVYRERKEITKSKLADSVQTELSSGNISLVRQAKHEAEEAAAQLKDLHDMIRAHAKWADERIVPLVEVLRDEGGIDPPPDTARPVVGGTELELLPNPFDW